MKHTGTNQFQEQPVVRRDTGTGSYIVRSWEGPSQFLESFLISGLPGGWIEREVSATTPFSTVRATFATEEPPKDRDPRAPDPINREWSLIGNEIQRSLWTHKKVLAAIADLSPDEFVEVRRKIRDMASGTSGITFINPDIQDLAERVLRGDDDYTVSQYVLRKIETVARSSQMSATHTHVNAILSRNKLIEMEPTLPSAVLVDWPGLAALYWSKRTPTVEPAANGRWQITQEYYGIEEADVDPWKYELIQ